VITQYLLFVVTLDKSLKIPSSWKMNSCIYNHSPTAFPTSELLSLSGSSKINSSIKPAPTSGLDLLGQTVTATADVRSKISKLSVPFPNKFHPPLRHNVTPALAVNVGGGEHVSP
jgi:hypothetical protein